MKSGILGRPRLQRHRRVYSADGRTAVIDMSAGRAAVARDGADGHTPRSYHNLTLLPDGTVLASGGGTRSDGVEIWNAVLPAEIWNPTTETWTTVAPLQQRPPLSLDRTAAARRSCAHGGRRTVARVGRGRPDERRNLLAALSLQGSAAVDHVAPSNANYGASFDVTTPDAAQIASVSLIRSPSVTHAFDENQRFQFLNFTSRSRQDSRCRPRRTRTWRRLVTTCSSCSTRPACPRREVHPDRAPADTTAPTVALTAPTAGSTVSNTIPVSATAGDDTGVVGVQFKLDGSNLAIEDSSAPYSVSWDTRLIANGSHNLTAVARDAAGNTTTSSAVAVTVSNSGSSPNLVAGFGFDEGSGSIASDSSGSGNNGTITGA